MSQTTPSPVELVPVDDAEELELELSATDPLDDEPAVDSSDPAGAVETPGWVMFPKLDALDPPPQAERKLVSARARRPRMTGSSLAKMVAGVTAVTRMVDRPDIIRPP